jgi:hypothetical protein
MARSMRLRNFIQRFLWKRPTALGVAAQHLAEASIPKTRRRLFTKYVALFVAVVCVALLSNGIFDVYFYYQEHKASLIRIQREQAEAAAAKIGQFIKEIESQLGWTTQLPWSAGSIEQRRFDALRLLRQVPAITELAQLDASGKERLRVSRLAMDVVGGGTDFSNDPKFTEAVARKVYYGPVYFRRESEPYMTLAIAGTRRDAGVSVAEVNLKLIWDVVSQIKVGERGHAYVVDAQGRLIAHPDISLVLRNTEMSRLAQVRAARSSVSGSPSETVQESENIGFAVLAGMFLAGRMVGSDPGAAHRRRAHRQRRSIPADRHQDGRRIGGARRPVQRHGRPASGILSRVARCSRPLRRWRRSGWLVFVELPADEAYAPRVASAANRDCRRAQNFMPAWNRRSSSARAN